VAIASLELCDSTVSDLERSILEEQFVVKGIIEQICKEKLQQNELATAFTIVSSEKVELKNKLLNISGKSAERSSFFKGLRVEFDRLSHHSVELREFLIPIAEKVIAQNKIVTKTKDMIAILNRVGSAKQEILLNLSRPSVELSTPAIDRLNEEIAHCVKELETVQEHSQSLKRAWREAVTASNPLFLKNAELKHELDEMRESVKRFYAQKVELIEINHKKEIKVTRVEKQIAEANAELISAKEQSENAQMRLVQKINASDLFPEDSLEDIERDIIALEEKIRWGRARILVLKEKMVRIAKP
jgi:chromosome segregation ATPase